MKFNYISMCDLVFLCILLTFSVSASSRELGTFGHTFPIKEESFLVMIARKLKTIDIEKHQEQILLSAEQKIQTPNPLKNVSPAKQTREFSYNPAYILQKDIVLPGGKLLYHKGTTINPLDYMDFNRKLYFIDGRESSQISWLQKELRNNLEIKETNQNIAREIRIILVAGSPLLLQEELDMQIFFDQGGELTSKFGIKSSPAILEQDIGANHKLLKIREIYIETGA